MAKNNRIADGRMWPSSSKRTETDPRGKLPSMPAGLQDELVALHGVIARRRCALATVVLSHGTESGWGHFQNCPLPAKQAADPSRADIFNESMAPQARHPPFIAPQAGSFPFQLTDALAPRRRTARLE